MTAQTKAAALRVKTVTRLTYGKDERLVDGEIPAGTI
jgi:hypothetical protein